MENTNLILIIVLSTTLIAGMFAGSYYLIKSTPVVTNVLSRSNHISINDIELNNLVAVPRPIYSNQRHIDNIIDYVPINNTNTTDIFNELSIIDKYNYIHDPNLIVSILEESKIYSISLFLLILLILILIGYSKIQRKLTNIKMLMIVIICISVFYKKESGDILLSILPLSITEITYYKDLNVNTIGINGKSNSKIFNLFAHKEMSNFIESLDIDCNYIITIEFIPDITELKDESPSLFISKPFIINKFSSTTIINEFIDNRLYQIVNYYHLDVSMVEQSSPLLLVNYYEF